MNLSRLKEDSLNFKEAKTKMQKDIQHVYDLSHSSILKSYLEKRKRVIADSFFSQLKSEQALKQKMSKFMTHLSFFRVKKGFKKIKALV
jgi:hypothetical protein